MENMGVEKIKFHPVKCREAAISPTAKLFNRVKNILVTGGTGFRGSHLADNGTRVNNICFSGVFNKQDKNFVERLSKLIPMERMAEQEEYKATILFLIFDAYSCMIYSTVVIEGGRTCW